MKTVTAPQFNALVVDRVTTATNALRKLVNTAENNPDHLTEEMIAKLEAHFTRTNTAVITKLRDLMEKKEVAEIADFTLGTPKESRPRKARAPKEAPPTPVIGVAPAPQQSVEETIEEIIAPQPKPEAPAGKVKTLAQRAAEAAAEAATKPAAEDDELAVAPPKKGRQPAPAPEPEVEDAEDTLAGLDLDAEEPAPAAKPAGKKTAAVEDIDIEELDLSDL